MTNVIPEKVRIGYAKEVTWGTNPYSGDANGGIILLPVEPPDIKEEIEHVLDSNSRGVMARDFEGYPGMRKVTGSLTGPIYLPSTSTSDNNERNVTAVTHVSHLGNFLRVFFGAAESALLKAASDLYSHQFYAVSYASTTPASSSLMLVLQDPITGLVETGTVPVYLGCMVPKLTISYNATEGMATWNADILGMRQRFLTLAAAPANANETRGVDSRDRSGRASLGYGALLRVFNQSTEAVVTGWDAAKLISAEITMEREIEIKVGAADQNYANIRAVRAPTITFKAVVEFQQYTDLQLYSNDTISSFYDVPHGWHFRLAVRDTSETSPGMPSTYSTINIPINNTAIDDNLSTNDGVLDIMIHFADIGEGPLVIDRSAVANTLEFSGRGVYLGGRRTATYTTSPKWLTDLSNPSTTAKAGMPVFQVRLINARTAAY